MSNAVAQPGDRVLIWTSELQEDPNVYRLDEVKRSVAFLTSVDTDRQVKAHKSRIREVLKEDNMSDTAVNDAANDNHTAQAVTENNTPAQVETETVVVDEEAKTEKPKRTRKPKVEPVTVNFDQAPFAGHEIFTKGGCKFDFDTITVAAHCVILENGYQTFNTYNGTLGKKGQLPEGGGLPGVFYSFNDKMNAEKKREQLIKKGYVLYGEAITANADDNQ